MKLILIQPALISI